MQVQGYTVGIGALIALLVLVVCLVFAISDAELTKNWVLGLIAALAVARLVP